MSRWLVVLIAGLAGCGDDTGEADATSGTGGQGCVECTAKCPAGFAARVEGPGCEPVLPADDCAPATMPVLGFDTCQPVGNPTCPRGFVPDESGFGCMDVTPPVACTGATMEVLGQSTCQPVGDCSASFPPAGATHFVDDDYGPADLDATHFATIGAAITAAPAGATLAIAPGSYEEAIDITKPLTLVGRCADDVVVTSTGDDAPGVQAIGVTGAVVRGLTLRGHLIGAGVTNGTLELEACVVDGARTVGLLAGGAGTQATLRGSVVRDTVPNAAGDSPWGIGAQFGATIDVEASAVSGNQFANVVALRTGATVNVARSVVRDGRSVAAGNHGMGVYGYHGGTVHVTESAILDNHAGGAISFSTSDAGEPSEVTVDASVVRGTRADDQGEFGRGLDASLGAHLVANGVWVHDNHEGGAVAVDGGSLEVFDSVITGSSSTSVVANGPGIIVSAATATATRTAVVRSIEAGVTVQQGGSLLLDHCLVQDSLPGGAPSGSPGGGGVVGIGASVASASQLELRASALVRNRAAGLVTAAGSTVVLRDSVVASTQPTDDGLFGRGVEATGGASLTLERCAILDVRQVGLLAGQPGTLLHVTDSVVADVALDGAAMFGHAVVSAEGADLTLATSTVMRAQGIGVGVAAASGFIDGGVVTECTVGVHVQDGVQLVEGSTPPGAAALTISPESQIVGNVARIGTGVVPMPTPIGATSP